MSLTTVLRFGVRVGLEFPSDGESGCPRAITAAVAGSIPICDELRLLGCSCDTEPVIREDELRIECGDLEWGEVGEWSCVCLVITSVYDKALSLSSTA